MALPELTATLNAISELDTVIRGQATAVKAAFDHDVNVIKDYLNEELVPVIGDEFETKENITTNRKLSETGNFTGTWNGHEMVETDPGIQSIVNGHTVQLEEIEAKLSSAGNRYDLASYIRGGLTAIGAMNQIVTEINTGSGNAIIDLGSDTYDFTTMVSTPIIKKDNVWIVGNQTTGIIKVLNGTFIQFGDNDNLVTDGGVIAKFVCDTTPNVNQVCVNLYSCSTQHISIDVRNISTAVVLGNSTKSAFLPTINIFGYKANNGTPMFLFQNGAGGSVNGHTYTPVANPVIDGDGTRHDMLTVENNNFITFNGTWDTLEITGLHERYYKNIYGVPTAGQIIQNITMNVTFDYTRNSCVWLDANGGIITNIYINPSSWMCSWENVAIFCNKTSGFFKGLHISEIKMPFSGSIGIYISGVSQVDVLNNLIMGTSQKVDSPYAIQVAGTCTEVNIDGNRLLDGTEVGFAWGVNKAIYVGADVDYLFVTHNDAYIIDVINSSTAKPNRTCKDNIVRATIANGNYSGPRGAFTLPTSGATATYLAPHESEINIFGGTVSSIVKNGVTVGGAGNFCLMLRSGDTYALGYTVAPTAQHYVKP